MPSDGGDNGREPRVFGPVSRALGLGCRLSLQAPQGVEIEGVARKRAPSYARVGTARNGR